MTIETFFIVFLLGMHMGYFISLWVLIRILERILNKKQLESELLGKGIQVRKELKH